MGHLCNIRDHHFSGNILSDCHRKIGLTFLKIFRFQKIPQHNGRIFTVRHLDPDCRFPRDRSFDPQIGHCKIQFNIIGKPDDLADFHALVPAGFHTV